MSEGANSGTDPGPVGLVLVSHSAQVAESVARLARDLAAGGAVAPVEAAGGTDDGGVGTSSERVAAAARRVDGGAGVVVLADLGSAVLTVRALLAEDELPSGTRLADAPFLEGAVAALVAASAGADAEAVAAAAEEAYGYRKL
ncbi:PTS-dependent dihydroxyacetone kinase phosphotransferase subunit DhaM [Streptomyces alkaliterrae]|uniref:PTS fructose transporter subunit IIA n=1 Tax=Streptomyces alkaliterrae TaxID=2213162 RepID=A0A5P0YXE2_9ACTN|nr:PTS fructose transporter subunit IIA [Streptomyces alkaliterrae]MBB1256510.1 PTS fructose transporter subunit IIA [Streptomyces alkaliterrae]MBB1262145.1 PTS fructose transporter subunit IIA [Streptomyces alkaliterrae]MQS04954.1 PTS fructose transporter subunit IIA [Streptomyces alkaliterrae]